MCYICIVLCSEKRMCICMRVCVMGADGLQAALCLHSHCFFVYVRHCVREPEVYCPTHHLAHSTGTNTNSPQYNPVRVCV